MFPSLLPTYNRADVAFVRGEGSYLFAEDGQRYLDFGAGIAVSAFGHAHPKLVAAMNVPMDSNIKAIADWPIWTAAGVVYLLAGIFGSLVPANMAAM